MKREEIFEYVKKQYGTIPEYLWKSSPESAILRHENGKWYAAILRVEKSKLGLKEEGSVDIILYDNFTIILILILQQKCPRNVTD